MGLFWIRRTNDGRLLRLPRYRGFDPDGIGRISEALNRSANRERKFLPNLKFRFRGVAFGYE
jgi:hypothetical protein